MAPEQIRCVAVDTRADLFALGVVMYECLTGRRPFEGRSTYEVLDAIVNRRPTPPGEVAPATPPALSDLCIRLLAKEPEATRAVGGGSAGSPRATGRWRAARCRDGIVDGPQRRARARDRTARSPGTHLAGGGCGQRGRRAHRCRRLADLVASYTTAGASRCRAAVARRRRACVARRRVPGCRTCTAAGGTRGRWVRAGVGAAGRGAGRARRHAHGSPEPEPRVGAGARSVTPASRAAAAARSDRGPRGAPRRRCGPGI